MQNQFTKFILQFSPTNSALPLIHTSDAFRFREVLALGCLKPSKCKVFKGENLIYMFYGRPAYRVKADESTSLTSSFPVSFILKPNSIKSAARVFPFDTGAFNGKLFSKYFHSKMQFDHFIVDPNPKSPNCIPCPEIPQRIITAFFGTNKHYYECRPKKDIVHEPLNFEVESFYELIKAKNIEKFDDRCLSIEVQITSSVEFNNNIEAVVLPTIFLEDDNVKDILLNKWKAKILDYATFRSDPSHCTILIIDLVKQYYISKGWI